MSSIAELKNAEARYRLILENQNDLIYIINLKLKIEYINEPVFERILGYTLADLKDNNILFAVHPDDKKKALQAITKGIKNTQGTIDLRIKKKNGDYQFFEFTGKTFTDFDGIQKALIIARDITEKKNFELKLKQSEKKYRVITENANDLIGILNKDFILEFVNEQACNSILGYTFDEVVGKNILDFVHPSDKERGLNSLIKAKEDKEGFIEIRARHENGTYIWLEVKGKVYVGKDGENKGVLIGRDITEKVEAEQKLKESEEKYGSLVEGLSQTGIGIDIIDTNYNIVYQNQYLKEQFGEIQNKKCFEFFLEREEPCEDCPMKKAIQTKRVEKEIIESPNNRTYEIISAPLLNPSGEIKQAAEVIIDITERKKSEDAIKLEKKFTEDLINAFNDTIFVFNPQTGKAIRWNTAFNKVSGYSDEEIDSMKAPDSYYNKEDLKRAVEATKNVIKGGSTKVEMSLKTKQNKTIPFEYSGTLIEDTDGNLLIVSIGRNITERKETEKKLKESEKKFRNIFENSPNILMLIDQKGVIFDVNQLFLKRFGFDKKELVGKDFRDINRFNPENILILIDKYNEIFEEGNIEPFELEMINTEGRSIWINFQASLIRIGDLQYILVIFQDITKRKLAELRLKESEEKFRNITEQSIMGISVIQDGVFKYFNDRVIEINGYTADEIKSWVPDEFAKLFHPDDREFVMEQAHKKQSGDPDVVHQYQFRIVRKDGEIRWLRIYSKTINYEGSTADLTMTFDITDKVETEINLKESEEKYRALFENMNAGFAYHEVIVDDNNKPIDYVYHEVNPAFERLTGVKKEDLIGKRVTEAIPGTENDPADWIGRFGNVALTGIPFTTEEYSEAIGKWFRVSGYSPKKGYFAVTFTDVTDMKEAGQKLKDSEERYRLISEASNSVIWTTDISLNLTYVSSNSLNILGYSAKEAMRLPLSSCMTPESLKSMTGILKEELRLERKKDIDLTRSRTFEINQIHKNGSIIPVEITFTFLRDGDGKTTGVLGVSRDISERKKAEQRLKDSELKFKDLYEEAPNAYFSIGTDKSIIRCNKAAERLLGYTRHELLEMKVFNLYSDGEYGVTRAKELFNQFLEGDDIHDVELQMKTKKGDIKWVSLSVKPIIDEEGKVIESRSMLLDINEKKLAQEELNESYAKLKELEYIINNSPSIVFLWKNAEGWPVEFVSENVKQFGYTPEDFYNGDVIYSEIIHPDDLERVGNEVQQHSNEDITEFEQEYRIITKSGEIKWIDDRTWIRRDLEGNITHFQGIVLDITDRKNATEALKDSEMKYRDAYDMATFYKDLFTHDMNNILQIINSSAEIIGFQLGDSEKSVFIENMTKMIQSQVDRGSKLISDVRTLTELDEQKITTRRINISKYLEFSINFVKKAYSDRKITINIENLDQKYYTNANDLLQDVFDNILINGVKYNENVDVEISVNILKEIIEDKKYYKIEIIDNGIGVPDNRKKVIFQRGNRALKGTKGMGIGLSLVKKILKIFGGEIWVKDKIEGDYTKGSKFIVILPKIA